MIIEDQPAPERGTVDVWPLVIADMHERDAIGRRRYGTPLQAGNGRDALVDLYQELLDAVVYLRQVIAERGYGAELKGWRDMASAPCDGTRILVDHKGDSLVARWDDDTGVWRADDDARVRPQFWRELPEAVAP